MFRMSRLNRMTQHRVEFVEDLPPSIIFELYRILDLQEDWRTLAAQLGYHFNAIEHFALARGSYASDSPTRRLILDWLSLRPTVRELYEALTCVGLVRAHHLLRNYVSEGSGCYEPVLPVARPVITTPSCQQKIIRNTDLPPPKPPPHVDNCRKHFNPSKNPSYREAIPESQVDRPPRAFADVNMNNLTSDVMKSQKDGHQPTENPESVQISSRPTPGPSVPSVNSSESLVQDGVVWGQTLINAVTFPYADIKEGTDDFNPKNVLGEGSFGIIYRAVLKSTPVAVKVLKDFDNVEEDKERLESNLTELTSLFIYRHKNIIGLVGYSVYGPKTCLVYEFMSNGSLDDRLRCKGGTKPLSWQLRHRIMMGAARGLQYLHTAKNKPLIHGDIKSSNILLDSTMEAKLSDFGQARQATGYTTTGRYTHVTDNQMQNSPFFGTRAYLPVDFIRDPKTSISTDTFSFGVVIFEVCTGQEALDQNRDGDGRYLRDFVRSRFEEGGLPSLQFLKDPHALSWPDQLYLDFINLGLSCTHRRKKERPQMTNVLGLLERQVGDIRIQETEWKFAYQNRNEGRLPPIGSSDNDGSASDTRGKAVSWQPANSYHMSYSSSNVKPAHPNFLPPSDSCGSDDPDFFKTDFTFNSAIKEAPKYSAADTQFNLERLATPERLREPVIESRATELELQQGMGSLNLQMDTPSKGCLPDSSVSGKGLSQMQQVYGFQAPPMTDMGAFGGNRPPGLSLPYQRPGSSWAMDGSTPAVLANAQFISPTDLSKSMSGLSGLTGGTFDPMQSEPYRLQVQYDLKNQSGSLPDTVSQGMQPEGLVAFSMSEKEKPPSAIPPPTSLVDVSKTIDANLEKMKKKALFVDPDNFDCDDPAELARYDY